MDRNREIRKVLYITLGLNLLVAAAKIAYGYYANSVAITSDGFHSMFDGVSNIVGLIGISIASRPPDEHHPYGHRKYETLFTICIGLLMFLTCFEILKDSYQSLQTGSTPRLDSASLAIMLGTLAVNIFVVMYERRMGVKLGSEFLVADSHHTQSDVFVTIGVIASVVFTLLGYPIIDPVAGFVVAIFVAKAGFSIIREATDILVDRALADTERIIQLACSVPGVVECHNIRARGTRTEVFVDIHILVDPAITVSAAHDIAEAVERRIHEMLPEVADVLVHIEPDTEDNRKKEHV